MWFCTLNFDSCFVYHHAKQLQRLPLQEFNMVIKSYEEAVLHLHSAKDLYGQAEVCQVAASWTLSWHWGRQVDGDLIRIAQVCWSYMEGGKESSVPIWNPVDA
jgi:hypothetical protein